mmetsp:Transcript_3760/g.8119  ORF Transcript_3760/g.8119 Transcript_3760/m.8119 type:complete len:254 (-) Transcript_3760:287-1048(-)
MSRTAPRAARPGPPGLVVGLAEESATSAAMTHEMRLLAVEGVAVERPQRADEADRLRAPPLKPAAAMSLLGRVLKHAPNGTAHLGAEFVRRPSHPCHPPLLRLHGRPLRTSLGVHPRRRLPQRCLAEKSVDWAWNPAAHLCVARVVDTARSLVTRHHEPVAHRVVDIGAPIIVQAERHAPLCRVIPVCHEISKLHVQRVDVIDCSNLLDAILVIDTEIPLGAVDAIHHAWICIYVEDAVEHDRTGRRNVAHHH